MPKNEVAPGTRWFNLSQPQHTEAGRLLSRFYYGSDGCLLREMATTSGFPHNGGEHTLNVKATPAELVAWLELLKMTFPGHQRGFDELVKSSFTRAKLEVPKGLLHREEEEALSL